MRTLLLAAIVATALAPGVTHAGEPNAAGFACDFTETGGDGTVNGLLDGGPVLVADLADPTGNPVYATVTCAMQVGGTGAYTDPDALAISASGPVLVVVHPVQVVLNVPWGDIVYVCTTWTLTDAHGNTETRYLDDATGELSSDPAQAQCTPPILGLNFPPGG